MNATCFSSKKNIPRRSIETNTLYFQNQNSHKEDMKDKKHKKKCAQTRKNNKLAYRRKHQKKPNLPSLLWKARIKSYEKNVKQPLNKPKLSIPNMPHVTRLKQVKKGIIFSLPIYNYNGHNIHYKDIITKIPLSYKYSIFRECKFITLKDQFKTISA